MSGAPKVLQGTADIAANGRVDRNVGLRPMLDMANAHAYEITDGGLDYYTPFMTTERHIAPATLTLKNGNIAEFQRAEKQPWGGWRLFYSTPNDEAHRKDAAGGLSGGAHGSASD